MHLTDKDKLAIFQAFYKKAGEVVSTKDPTSLRSRVDEEYRRKYEEDGGKSFDYRLLGEKVGTYSIRVEKAVPAHDEPVFRITDPEELLDWVKANWESVAEKYIYNNAADFATSYFEMTGEIPDGCVLTMVHHEATPERYKCGVLNIKSEDVASVLGAQLPDAMNTLMLEEEIND